jgi:dephospho-CoA kinase
LSLKKKRADSIINNRGSRASVARQVRKLLRELENRPHH